PVWYLVPDGVVQYINKYGLYVHDEHTSTTLLAVDRDTENGPRETTRSTL
ncbi:MAG: nicotinate-nucleotide adenylyltransferase, partial [Kocuria sp.]|nr:nicotinate-nucleotide adenylyltransferase [Kocuria sp.]